MDKLTRCVIKEMAWMPAEGLLDRFGRLVAWIKAVPFRAYWWLRFLPGRAARLVRRLLGMLDSPEFRTLCVYAQFFALSGLLGFLMFPRVHAGAAPALPNAERVWLSVIVAFALSALVVSVVELGVYVLYTNVFVPWKKEAERRCIERYVRGKA